MRAAHGRTPVCGTRQVLDTQLSQAATQAESVLLAHSFPFSACFPVFKIRMLEFNSKGNVFHQMKGSFSCLLIRNLKIFPECNAHSYKLKINFFTLSSNLWR